MPIAPEFPKGISAPAFLAASQSDEFDPITGAQTWMVLWARKLLGVDPYAAETVLRDLLNELSATGIFEVRHSDKGPVWGLPQSRIEFVHVEPHDGVYPPTELRCTLCATAITHPPERFADWIGRPCMRLRCTGTFAAAPSKPTNYYRRLYSSGQIRRVVAAEHTGLLTQKEREHVEHGFKRAGLKLGMDR